MKKTLIAALMLVAALGCKQKSSTESASSSPQPTVATEQAQNATPEQLGQIGAQIKHHPSDANKILADHGLTQESFAKAIRQVASDPAASRRYRDAYKKSV